MSPHSLGADRTAEPRPYHSVPGGGVAGVETVAELPTDVSTLLWRVLRTVLLWAAEDAAHRGELLEGDALAGWEESLLTSTFDAELRMPLAVIVGELGRGEKASPGRVSWACLCITDWALARRGSRTALAFAEAAALASPEQPRYAWVAGRMMRTFGRLKESTQWLRRAVRVAVRSGDWEAKSRGLNSLGNTFLERGDFRDAARLLESALRTAQRKHLRRYEAENRHDLFVVYFEMGEWARAEEHARGAFEIYHQLSHPRLPMLAHDVAYLWLSRGYFARALNVLRALEPVMLHGEDRLRVLTSAIRAAGATRDEETFSRFWEEAWPLAVELGREKRYSSSAFLEMALGASSLSLWDRAREALEITLELARERGESDVVFRAEAALPAIQSEQAAETVRSAPTAGNSPSDALARRMVSSLETVASTR